MQRNLQEIIKKIILGTSDDWSFVPVTQWPSILYWRLSDFYISNSSQNDLLNYLPYSCNCQPMDYQVNVKVRCLIYLYSKFLNAQPEVQIFELAVGCRNVSFFKTGWLWLILFFVHVQENGTLDELSTPLITK